MIRKRQLKFTGDCILMLIDEPNNRFVLYESKVRSPLRPGAPTSTYRQQIHRLIFYPSSESARTHRNKKDGGEQIYVE